MKIVNAWLCTASNLVDTFEHDKKKIMLGTITAVTFFSVQNLCKAIHSNVLYSSQ